MNPSATLGHPRVSDLMSRHPAVIRDDASVARAAALLDDRSVHGLPVIDEDGQLVGVVSQSDMIRARTTQHLWTAWHGLKVRHLMSAPALTIAANATLEEAAARMEANGVHRLVVLGPDGLSPMGIVSTTDLVRGMLEERSHDQG